MVLHLPPAEVRKEPVPGRLLLVVAQVRDQLPSEDLERGGLADPVPADEADHLALPDRRDPEEPEGVDPVLVDLLRLELFAQVQYVDGVEGADLDADSAADAERLGDERDFVAPEHDALLAVDVDGAVLDAL